MEVLQMAKKEESNLIQTYAQSLLSERLVEVASVNNFLRLMNVETISNNGFKNIREKMIGAYDRVAKKSMKRAADSSMCEKDGSDKRVKIDGAWQRRGHASLNGYTAAVIGVNMLLFCTLTV